MSCPALKDFVFELAEAVRQTLYRVTHLQSRGFDDPGRVGYAR